MNLSASDTSGDFTAHQINLKPDIAFFFNSKICILASFPQFIVASKKLFKKTPPPPLKKIGEKKI